VILLQALDAALLQMLAAAPIKLTVANLLTNAFALDALEAAVNALTALTLDNAHLP